MLDASKAPSAVQTAARKLVASSVASCDPVLVSAQIARLTCHQQLPYNKTAVSDGL